MKLSKTEKRQNSRLLRELAITLAEANDLTDFLDDTVEMELRQRGFSSSDLSRWADAAFNLAEEVKRG